MWTRSQTCSLGHMGGCQNLHDGFFTYILYRHGISLLLSEELSSLLPNVVEDLLSHRQSWPSNLVREQTIVLFVSDHCTSLLVLVCHDWNYMSLLLNIVHVLSTENTLPLSSLRRLSFLFNSRGLILFPQLRSGLWSFEFSSSDQYEVLQMSQSYITCLSIVSNGFLIVQSQDGLKLNRVLYFFDLCNPSRITSEGISLGDNRAWSHRTSKPWMSPFCKRILKQIWFSQRAIFDFSMLNLHTCQSPAQSPLSHFPHSRPIQLSVHGFCEDFCPSLNVCTTFWSPSLLSRDTDSERLENNCFTIHVRTSLINPSTVYNKITIRHHLRDASPPIHQVSTKWEFCWLPNVGCCLMLQDVEASQGPLNRWSLTR